MFDITTESIQAEEQKNMLADHRGGGIVIFEGCVRNHNEGKTVTKLEYEAYSEMAIAEGNKIIAEALANFDVLKARCVHRLGELALGETAVWIGIIAEHRRPAFEACMFIIDEIKKRLPIWKKEYYVDGESVWVHCNHCD